jgi:iron complex transport system substrate-binding protein
MLRLHTVHRWLLSLLALMILGSGARDFRPPVGAQGELIITDARGQEVRLSRTARVVSASGDITEILYALNLQDRLVGVDSSSTYPPEALQTYPKIGFARRLTAEPIAALNPDLVLCTQTCSPEEVFEQLETLGIPVLILPDSESPDLSLPRQKIELVGQIFGLEAEAARLAERVEREMAWAQAAVLTSPDPAPAVFNLYTRGQGLQLAAGAATPADVMIRGAGGINAAAEAGVEGYQGLSPEIILTAFPDWILLTTGNVEASGGIENVLSFQGLSATPAVREGRIVVLDTGYLLGMSTRTGLALMELARVFHPKMTWEAEASYPYTYTDASGQAVTLEQAPQILIASNPALLEASRQLGFHSEMANALPEGALILAAQSDEWASLRAAGGLVIVLPDDFSLAEVAAALNVPGRAAAYAQP